MAKEFYNELLEKKIKVVAWDFDGTILEYDTSTSDYFQDFADFKIRFLDNISPFFKKVSREIQRGGKIKQFVVSLNDGSFAEVKKKGTLMTGTCLIKSILKHLKIDIEVISWNPSEHNMYSPGGHKIKQNKNWHLQSITRRCKLKKKQILLIDDLNRNIKAASKIGYQTILFN
jgi:histidinol phosphatase-like enzyme